MTVTCQELMDRFRAEYPTTRSLTVDLGPCLVEVDTNDEPLYRDLVHYFQSFRPHKDHAGQAGRPVIRITAHQAPEPELWLNYVPRAPEPGKSKVKEETADIEGGRVVRKRLTGMHFVFGPGGNLAVGPCRENPNQVINFVNNRFIELLLNQGCLLGHASGIAMAGRGMALAGFAGAGKSTLALHAMGLGADLVSNDRVLVRPGRPPLFFGVAKHPRINPGTALNNPHLARVLSDEDRARFAALPPNELWNLEHKYDAIVEECFGPGRFRLAAPMNALMILHWTRGGGPMRIRLFDPRERHDLLAAFMKATGSFYLPAPGLPQDQPVTRYAEALAHCACIEVYGGVNFEAAARACLYLLRTGAVLDV